ncbi:aminopeptidase P family protein [Microbaculum marinum]|uniref:Aminopeptidase P family protein n=1 Tax=Microbaculum marinum TaxID=1764581 RepID=A0AAW9RPU9_9HYPH
MFQTFDEVADPSHGAERLSRLQAELERRGLDGFLIPRSDEHQGEYVPPSAERLKWLTGFSGSAGIAVVLKHRAAIFVDGRYTLQVRDQVDTEAFEPRHLITDGWDKWLEEHLWPDARLGYDPWLHTIAGVKRLQKIAETTGARLVASTDNPLDAVWADRPAPPLGKVAIHTEAYAGRTAQEKIAEVQAILSKAKAGATVLTQPESIAWLFNIRGSDVAHTPLPLSFAVVPAEGRPTLVIDGRKLSNASRDHIEAVADVAEPATFGDVLDRAAEHHAVFRLDEATAAQWISDRLEAAGARILPGEDPCLLPKATKNAAEIAGARSAHLRDGAAVCRFLAWLDREAPSGHVDEIAAATKLEACRAETGALKEISFDTISGAGPNGAIVHYRVTTATNRPLKPGELYLVDSGAQYVDGTTDITRTVAVGVPSDDMRRHFTLVLKGHIAIATARFPEGTSGAQIDTLARYALWQAGLDFDHGTGHGVGSYLSVHEGPQRIAKTGSAAFKPGMIVSNEPGYYKTGEYGIRIENLELVTDPVEVPGGEKKLLSFEALTLVPFDRRLVDPTLLTPEEIAWLDAYHARVRELIGPHLQGDDRDWLIAATEPV